MVIPSFDEMANLQKGVLEKVVYFLNKKKFNYEVIIIDDGSTDGSIEFVEKFIKENSHFKLIKNKHTGKAGAVTTGMLKASGNYLLFTDMDQATPITEVEKLLPYFKEGFDVVIGSRSGQRKGAPWTRLVMARGMIILRTLLIGIRGISDTQCGFKIFTKEAAKNIFTKINDVHHGFRKISGSSVTAGFDVELLYIAQLMGYKIKEVSVEWLYVETRRVNPIKDSIDGLLDLIRIKKNSIKALYK
ncbi:MAG: glycosyltransferase [Actinobacteria bacterium]|nr:glycosyltransferase [Actinomycetota bacterium]